MYSEKCNTKCSTALSGIRAGDTFVTDSLGKTNATFEQVRESVRNSPRPLQLYVRRVVTFLTENPLAIIIAERKEAGRSAAMIPGRKKPKKVVPEKEPVKKQGREVLTKKHTGKEETNRTWA